MDEPVKQVPAQEAVIDPNSPEERAEIIPLESWQTEPLHHEVAKFLGIESREADQYAPKVNEILNYIIQKLNTRDDAKIFSELRKMDENLYRMDFSEKKINAIYRYMTLLNRRDAVDQAVKSMEKKESRWG